MFKKRTLFTVFIAFSCFASADINLDKKEPPYSFASNNRNSLKIDCNTNFYEKYGIEHSLLEAMSYAYLGDVDIEKTMQSNQNNNVGFGVNKSVLPYIEEKTGFNEKDLKTSYCANYEVMAWFIKNYAGYNGSNRIEALKTYYYGENKRERYFAVEAVERLLEK